MYIVMRKVGDRFLAESRVISGEGKQLADEKAALLSRSGAAGRIFVAEINLVSEVVTKTDIKEIN